MLLKPLGAALLLAMAAQAASAAATVACSAGVANCAEALDGYAPPLGAEWQTDTASWSGTSEAVTVDLGGEFTVGFVVLSLDNNDSYAIESSLNGTDWSPLGTVAHSDGTVGWGMDLFTGVPGSEHYVPTLAFAPTSAAFLRVRATDGDNLYSVGELTYATAPVPEPATWALMLAGAAGLALRRRRA